jgi:uncharacterized membrane protein
MAFSSNDGIINQLRQVLKDGIDYLHSVIELLQARLTEYALSSVLFIILVCSSALLGLAAFVFLNIALGFWLKGALESTTLSILILGGGYLILSLITGGIALRWLNNLKS